MKRYLGYVVFASFFLVFAVSCHSVHAASSSLYLQFDGNFSDSSGNGNTLDVPTSYSFLSPSGLNLQGGYVADPGSENYVSGSWSMVTDVAFTDPTVIAGDRWGVLFAAGFPRPNEAIYIYALGSSGCVIVHADPHGGYGAETNPICDKNFHQIAVTYDATSSVESIYLDGAFQASTTLSLSLYDGNYDGDTLSIGDEWYNSGQNFVGDMQYFVLSNTVYSPTDIASFAAFGGYYAQIENTSTLNLYDASSTSADILKTLPADWILQVVNSADASDSPMTDGSGNTWFKVLDPTDDVIGWMVASDTTTQYISSYDGGAQAALEASSSDQIATGTTEDADIIMGAIDHYYNDANTNNSLYSSDDASGINAATGATSSNYLSIFKERGYPENFILGIAAHEDGLDPYDFDNETMSFDYGGGIMQVTFKAYSTEPTSTGNPWNFINNTWDNRGIGSGVTVPPCASYETSTYANCYAHAGVQNGYSKSYQPYGGVPGAQEYKQYSNTIQSIYANVKDGMKALEGAYFGADYWNTTSTENNEVCNYTSSTVTIYPPDVPATTTFSCTDREIILTTADYNGGEYGAISGGTTTNYLYDVASDTINIGRFFSTSTDATTTAIADKMILANNSNVYMQLHSPGDLSIQDTHGHVVGVVDGVATNTFPFASYDPVTKTAHIFFPQDDNLTYKVTGTGTGVYGLDIAITSGTQQIAFHRDENVPIIPGEVDTYTINPVIVLSNGNGVTLNVDKKGNGTVNEVQKFGANIVTLPLGVDHNAPYQELPKPKKNQTPVTQSQPIVITPRFQAPTTTSPANFSTTIPMIIASSTIATSTE